LTNLSPIDWQLPYASRRSPVLARNAVATSQPLAAQAGLRMLLAGGNAVDAAIATAITLTVVEPTMNGIGSDAFAIVWDGKKLHGLNGSGRSPRAWNPARFAGRTRMPTEGWDSVTVPGVVSAWVSLSDSFGKLPFENLFEPAIAYAENGFPVSPTIAGQWQEQAPRLMDQPGFAETFLPNGRPPVAGECFRSSGHAATLRQIAATHGDAFYRGDLAEKIVACSAQHGGAMTMEDLASHQADAVDPISVPYRSLTLHEIPPNGQGIAALMALGILEHFDLASMQPDSAAAVHLQAEAMKLAFADVYRYVADPTSMELPAAALQDPDYLRERASLIDLNRAQVYAHGQPSGSETIYLTTADASGMMVSFIQSNYMGFGSGVVVPGTGISLQNRGYGFSLSPDHPNCVDGGKRPFQTIIPGFVMNGADPFMSFGVMGADMQAQGHVQVMVRTADFEQNPQAVADAPRWKVLPDHTLLIEQGYPKDVLTGLADLGHDVVAMPQGSHDFGAAQLIRRMDYGYAAASEPRRDGQAIGF
jgi:gamma-glutamyltranspeptidase/glutathione hydrolase